MKEILQILLLVSAFMVAPGNHHRNDTSRACSLADFTMKAYCTVINQRLLCKGGFTSNWIKGIRRDIQYLQVLGWQGECFNVGHLQHHFPELRTLEFINCTALKNFKGRFTSASHIEKISMHGLTSLWEVPPDIIFEMQELRELDLRWNTLRHMKPALFIAPRLERVYLSGNLWDCSDNGLDWLAMEMDNGTIKSRMSDYYDLVCHQRLYRGKPLHIVMDIIQKMRETCPDPCVCVMTHVVSDPNGAVIPLITVDCAARHLEAPPDNLPPSTTTLRLEGNKFTLPPQRLWRGLCLAFLYEIKSEMRRFVDKPKSPTYLAQRISKLKWQWAGHIARRTDEPQNIKEIPYITSIRSIVHNPKYKRLADLYLDNNTISAVKELEGTEWFTSFRVLSLRGNKLKQIPVYAFDKALQANNNIMHVFLGHNPWRCDCHFIPRFQSLLRKYKRVITDLKDIRCSQSSDKQTSLIQISTMPLGVVCSSGKELPISVINIVNLVLLFLILIVIGRFLYDWHSFKTTGKLPWLSSILP